MYWSTLGVGSPRRRGDSETRIGGTSEDEGDLGLVTGVAGDRRRGYEGLAEAVLGAKCTEER